MKELSSKLNLIFRDRKCYFFIVLIMFCLGISFGLYTVKNMGLSDKNDLLSYFASFTKFIENEPINYGSLLYEVVMKNIIIIVPIIIFGLTFFGTPLILILDLIRGFILGFSFSFIVTTFEGKGIGLALAAIIPQNVIYIPCFIALSVISLVSSTENFKFKFLNGSHNKRLFGNNLLYKLTILTILFIAGMLVETYISPNILKLVAKKFYV